MKVYLKTFQRQKIKYLGILMIFLIIPLILSTFNNIQENGEKDTINKINLTPKLNSPPNENYFGYYKVITIDNTMVNGSTDLYNFPMLFSILDQDLHDDVQSNGSDIAFANESIWLNHEIESFNQGYNGTHAELIVWVQIPTLSYSTTTNITMYYGNLTMGAQENPSGVWDSNYKGIWHLKEDPADSAPQFQDSTSNNNDGTASGGSGNLPIQEAGKIDGSLKYDDFFDRSVDVSDQSSLQLPVNITLSAWVKTSDVGTPDVDVIVAKWKDPALNKNYWLGRIDADLLFIVNETESVSVVTSTYITPDTWHYIVGVADSSGAGSLRLYIDGFEVNTNSYSGTSNTGTGDLSIGKSPGSPSQEWNGNIDEVRVSNIVHSADWIATEYNNQYDPPTFFTIGSEIKIDNTPPTYSNLIESSDPLELGDTEVIAINVSDPKGINQTKIEFEGTNHSMTNIGGDTWQYSSWAPNNVGNYTYTIWMEDNYNNWNSTIGAIEVIDTTPPTYSDLIESADPLELGLNETITINAIDLSGINLVYLEYGGTNYTMTDIGGDQWRWTNWQPTSAGVKNYKIYIEDNNNNWNETGTLSIIVQDTIAPQWFTVVESADLLELGLNETITINATDLSGINLVYLEYGGTNYTMTSIGGNQWQWTNWQPASTGVKNYKLYIKDNNNNWNETGTLSITVQDTNAPQWFNVVESADLLELGLNETITINATDLSGINLVYLEYGGVNYTMTDIGGDQWQWTNWQPASIGVKNYTIYIEDNNNNWNETGTLSITVQDTTAPQWSNLVESADPLEFGLNETIMINTTDLSGINLVYLEYGGTNYSMTNIGGSQWQWTNWQPASTGVKNYTIYIEDYNNNWNETSTLSITVQDTTAPQWSNVVESDDLLELGLNETITINATDLSGINLVYLEYGGTNYTMTSIGGNQWQWTNWQPASTGDKYYKIYIEDNKNNWNETGTLNITVQDTIAPQWSNVVESADLLELGLNETITINATDLSGINLVYLEYGGTNYTMTSIGGNQWQWTSWQPASTGVKNYKLYIKDNNNKWNETGTLDITVQDTTAPQWSNVVESADPLELGDNQIIKIDIDDVAGINLVYLEYGGVNYTMTDIGGDQWQWTNWQPASVGIKNYTIYIEDNNNNWNETGTLNITVQDTTAPQWFNVVESANPLELGLNETITINTTDLSGINLVYLEYGSTNYTMTNIGGDQWQWTNWQPASVGIKNYTIYIEDNNNNWNETGTLNITVQDDATAPKWSNVVESADLLELGLNETITINATDLNGINLVYLEYGGTNYTMMDIGGNQWQWTNWQPTSAGIKNYKIYIEDNNNNWNETGALNITVKDTTAPQWFNVVENADPLEFGLNETITINATDLSGINLVYLEYGGTNYTMTDIGGDQWQWTNWQPASAGLKNYKLYIEDNNNNWNETSTLNITVQDNIAPQWSNVVESADLLELGLFETITINATDLSGINLVYLEYGGTNYTMTSIGGNQWQWTNWKPASTGVKNYKLYIKDNNNKWNETGTLDITVQDTTAPQWSNVVESADPLELGDNQIIKIDIDDVAGINLVYLEYGGVNYTMTDIGGDQWQWTNWQPASVGVKNYTIYIEDNNNNWNETITLNITVQDTTPPSSPILTNSPSGDISGTIIFDWSEDFDFSGISYYILIIDNETDPFLTPGFVYIFNITNIGPESSYYELNETLPLGKYYYFLAQIDGTGQQGDYTIGTFTVILIDNSAPGNNNFFLFAIIIGSVVIVAVTSIVIVRKRSHKGISPPRKKIPLKIILLHITNIINSQLNLKNKEIQDKIFKGKQEKYLNVEDLTEEKELEIQINETKSLGEELFAEGAYLEALKQFKLGKELLLKLGREEEVNLLSDLVSGIEGLIEEREKRLEMLEQVKIDGKLAQIYELYYDLVEISKKLKDLDGVSMYQSELIEYIKINKFNLIDIEKHRDNLKQKAESLSNDNHFEMAAQKIYEKCENISQLLVQLGKKEEIVSIEEFRKKKIECLEKIS